MISYWEQESFLEYDYIIIGAGIVGLSAAIELKEKFPGKEILVAERGILPAGASTRNAGFACMGSLTELIDDLLHSNKESVIDLFARRKKGLEILRQRLGDDRIGYEAAGSYEVMSADELNALDKMETINDMLLPVTGKPAFRLASEKIQRFGFDTNSVKALVENTDEGALHTGQMMRALTKLALEKGIEIKTGVTVSRFESSGNRVNVFVNEVIKNDTITLKCNQLFICTNAFTKALLPDVSVKPGRGQVLITEPIKDIPFQGIFHFDKGYYYFRNINDRILFGGGRNLDFETEATTEFLLNEMIQNELEKKLREIILPGFDNIKIANRWSGIMAFGESKEPVVSKFRENIYGAFRLGGMGVALGSMVAKELITLATD